MKKFFTVFAFVFMAALISFTSQASAEAYIDIYRVDFNPSENKVTFLSKMGNTFDKPIVITKIDVRSINVYDADRNLIWSNAATFDNIEVFIPANGEIDMPFTIFDAPDVPNYNGNTATEDDTLIEWVIQD